MPSSNNVGAADIIPCGRSSVPWYIILVVVHHKRRWPCAARPAVCDHEPPTNDDADEECETFQIG